MMLGRSNKRQEFYVIRIGYIGMDSPRKFDDQGLYASPPRLASLGMTQLQFHRSTEDIVLHTKIQLFDNSKYDGKDDGNKDDQANAKQRAMTRAKILYLKTNPEVVGQIAAVDTKSRKRKHSDSKISKKKRAKLVRETTRLETLSQFGKESVWTLSQFLLQVEQKTLDEAKNNGKP